MCDSDLNVKVVITHPNGLHTRPALNFAKLAKQFKATIEVANNGVCGDAKSILDLLSLGAKPNSELAIRAKGADAQQALDALAALVKDNFGIKNDEK